MAFDFTRMPYTVECYDSERWDVVGPTGRSVGRSFARKSEAAAHAAELSQIYLTGAQDAITALHSEAA